MEESNEGLIALQENMYDNMTKFVRNYKKDSQNRKTLNYYQKRLSDFAVYWATFKANHEKLIIQDVSKENPYIADDFYCRVEDFYIDSYSEIEARMEQSFPASTSAKSGLTEQSLPHVRKDSSCEVKLPQVQMPIFTGRYEDWSSFRDIFDSMINSNESISDVQKLYYLKSQVSGEAEHLIKHFSITASNYASAWNALKERYENTRILVNAQLKRLFSQAKISTDNVSNVKLLLDTTQECLATLNNLQVNTNEWDPILVYMTVQKLSNETLQLWEQSLSSKKDIPTFEQLKTFLECRFRTLEAVGILPHKAGKAVSIKTSYHVSKPTCSACGGEHFLSKCASFSKKPNQERLEIIKSNNLCFNCFSPSHAVRQCSSKYSCNRCKRRHHSQLHDAITSNFVIGSTPRNVETNLEQILPETVEVSSHFSQGNHSQNTVLLSTALVQVSDSFGNKIIARALLDQGSQSTFISEFLVQNLKLRKIPIFAQIAGIGNRNIQPCYKAVSITLSTAKSKLVASNVNALVLKNLTSYAQNLKIKRQAWEHIEGLTLADPDFDNPDKIDILIGADLYPSIILDGCIRGPKNTPMAQNSIFGWILTGPIDYNLQDASSSSQATKVVSMHTLVDLHNQLRAFWEMEEVPQNKALTPEEESCEEIFQNTFVKENGRYTVQLPFKINHDPLGESKKTAIFRFLQLERKFSNNPAFESQYSKCMTEYLELDHMSKVDPSDADLKVDEQGYHGYYLPHHAVLKEDSTTTKLRVVFNASQKTSNGVSLNDKLMIGPNIQENMIAILNRWRFFKIAFAADIAKMYLQIRVAKNHTDYQRIIWRKSKAEPLEEYRLLTVTFGMDCSAYLAIRTLKQLAEDEKPRFPIGAETVSKEFYVDNLLSGADSVTQAIEKQTQVIDLLDEGGFTLRKWVSNQSEVLEQIPSEYREFQEVKAINFDTSIKTLGLYWNPIKDTFSFKIKFKPVTDFPTKRSILSDISKLYDPLGWMSPIIISGKILIQSLWLAGLDWDEKVPTEIKERWLRFAQDLYKIEALEIPRWTGLNVKENPKVEVHVFCDSSKQAYAAVLYLRIQNGEQCFSRLLASKTRVAPVKPVSLPKLELCGALLAAKLTFQTLSDLKFLHVNIIAWTDSTIVLAWLRGQPNRWKTFVANRVGEIHQTLKNANWRYVPSSSNPADLPTRGVHPDDLVNRDLWWKGPEWLTKSEHFWPKKVVSEETPFERKVTHFAKLIPDFNLMNKFSSVTKLLRVTAFCLRFIKNCRLPKGERIITHLSVEELNKALISLIKYAQNCDFYPEGKALKDGRSLSPKSKLLPLTPFLDKGIIRLGGRLENAQLCFEEKHPIILAPTNPLSKLLIKRAHAETLHGGAQLILSLLRRKYWILGARNAVRKILHECFQCWRQKTKVLEQQMGNLPFPRVNASRPFTHTGVDYFGPIEIKANKYRKANTYKGYVSLFICLAVKAIHLELVSDLTTESFLAAFRRFTSRRGLCSDLYSDQGTNFKGASKVLKDDFKCCIRQVEHEAAELLVNDQINWHFIPPSSPHFGGLWEAGVKSTKYHLKRILGNSKLTFEEMSTLLAQVEATLNSRPICPMTSDPDDVTPLTPGHFLIGEVLKLPPESNLLDIAENRLNRWQRIQQLHQQFWSRWRKEYLHRLQMRSKWFHVQPNICVDELVLVKDYSPPGKWLLGRILKIHLGKDGLARVVTLRTKQSSFVRPITKLCKLPYTA